MFYLFFFFKQKTAYEILTCDWSSDVCSSDLTASWSKILPLDDINAGSWVVLQDTFYVTFI